jgi:hypothetical protein
MVSEAERRAALGPIYRTAQEKARETGGYVSVTDPGTPGVFDPSVATGGTTYSGSYGGGGSSGSGGNNAAAIAAAKAAAEAAAIEAAKAAAIAAAKAAEARERFARETSQATLRKSYESQIRVQGKGVETGGRKYYGGAVVPGTGGKTASQIQNQAFREARKKFGEGTKKGGYAATYGKDYFSEQIKEEVKTTSFKIGELPPTTSNVFSIPDSQKYGGVNNEKYNFQSGMFETTPSPYGQYGQGTINIISSRLPTPEEQRKIDILESNVATANLGKLKLDIKETSGIRERIDVLSTQIEESLKGKVNKAGEFIGTEEEFRKYENLYGKYEKANLRLQATDRTLDFSFFTKSKKVKLSEMDAVRVGQQIGIKYWQTIPKQTGELYGDIYGDTLAKIKIGKQPQAVIDMNTGVYRLGTESDVPTIGKNIVTPEQVGKVSGQVLGFAKYAVPVIGLTGLALESEQDIRRSGGVVEFVKQKPVEAGLLVGVGLLGGGMVARSLVKGARVSKAVTKELAALEKVKLKGAIFIQDGKVYAEGYKIADKSRQTIRYYGELKKSKQGVEFISSGKGIRITEGEIIPKATTIKLEEVGGTFGKAGKLKISKGTKNLEPQRFKQIEEFEISSGGKNIQKGFLSDVPIKVSSEGGSLNLFLGSKKPVYAEVGSTGIVPKELRFGITSALQKEKVIARKLSEQLKISRELPAKQLDITLPTKESNLIQLRKDVGLKISPSEEVGIYKFPSEKEVVLKIGGGKKSSQEFLDNMFKTQKLIKPEIKSPEVLPSIKESSTLLGSEGAKPTTKIISGLPIGASTYAGTGQYEQFSVQLVSPKMLNVQMNNVKVREESMIKIGIRSDSVSRIIQKEKQVEERIVKPFIRETTKISPKETQKSRLLLKEFLVSKQVQKQKLEQIQKINQRLRPKLTTSRPKIIIPKKLIPLFEGFKTSKGKGPIDEEIFKVFGKRYGEFKEIGKAKTKKEAKEKAKEFSLQGLGASTFISESGKKIEFNLGSGFRKSKVDKFVQVQRRGQRLSSFQERSEIKLSRRKKKLRWI